jgi:hypothetical protein
LRFWCKSPLKPESEPVAWSVTVGIIANALWLHYFGEEMPDDLKPYVATLVPALSGYASRWFVTPVAGK